jgi:hypothetical protein
MLDFDEFRERIARATSLERILAYSEFHLMETASLSSRR